MDKIIEANFNCIDIANFWMHVKKTPIDTTFRMRNGPCWEWQGTLFNSGYGHFICHCKDYRAHRVAYYLYNGTLSKDLFICHKCDNRKCVNPKHMFEGTSKQNINDMMKKKRLVKYRSVHKDKASKYHGVFFRKDTKKWRVLYMDNYKWIRLGTFDNEIDAALAYDIAIKNFNSSRPKNEHRKLNFPEA
jgi:hypothetical protein